MDTTSHLLHTFTPLVQWPFLSTSQERGDLKKVQNGLTGLTVASVSFEAFKASRSLCNTYLTGANGANHANPQNASANPNVNLAR